MAAGLGRKYLRTIPAGVIERNVVNSYAVTEMCILHLWLTETMSGRVDNNTDNTTVITRAWNAAKSYQRFQQRYHHRLYEYNYTNIIHIICDTTIIVTVCRCTIA